MKVVYLDTNLYISLIKSNDHNYLHIQKIISQSHLSFVTSPITLVELSSVLTREYKNLQLEFLYNELGIEQEEDPDEEIILFLIEYLITKTRTTIIQDPQIEILSYFPIKFMISPINKIAMLQSSKIKLRTLDLMHFSYAYHYNSVQKIRIDYLLSGDHNFISSARYYGGDKDFTFITPETIIELECNTNG